MSGPAVTLADARELADKRTRERMEKLVGRCELFFGSNIKSAVAQLASRDEIVVALEKWDGSKRVVPEHELERVFAGAS